MPIEVKFFPTEKGQYDGRKVEVIDRQGKTYNPLESDFIPDAMALSFRPQLGSNLPEEDVWRMRRDILLDHEDGDKEPVSQLDDLTLVYGRFGQGIDDLTVPIDLAPSDGEFYSPMLPFRAEYREWRGLVRAAMLTKMDRWPELSSKFPQRKVQRICDPVPLTIEWRGGRPVGVIKCFGILQGLIASLQVDAVIGAEWRFCACVGCSKSFKVTRHDQRYCDDDCKHRQVVRNGREQKRAKAAQLKIEGEQSK